MHYTSKEAVQGHKARQGMKHIQLVKLQRTKAWQIVSAHVTQRVCVRGWGQLCLGPMPSGSGALRRLALYQNLTSTRPVILAAIYTVRANGSQQTSHSGISGGGGGFFTKCRSRLCALFGPGKGLVRMVQVAKMRKKMEAISANRK